MMLDRLRATRCPSPCHCDLPEEPCPLVWAHTEIERLQTEHKALGAYLAHQSDNNDKLRAEIERLQDKYDRLGDVVYAKNAEIERLRDLLAFNGIDPDATIEAAKGAAKTVFAGKEV